MPDRRRFKSEGGLGKFLLGGGLGGLVSGLEGGFDPGAPGELVPGRLGQETEGPEFISPRASSFSPYKPKNPKLDAILGASQGANKSELYNFQAGLEGMRQSGRREIADYNQILQEKLEGLKHNYGIEDNQIKTILDIIKNRDQVRFTNEFDVLKANSLIGEPETEIGKQYAGRLHPDILRALGSEAQARDSKAQLADIKSGQEIESNQLYRPEIMERMVNEINSALKRSEVLNKYAPEMATEEAIKPKISNDLIRAQAQRSRYLPLGESSSVFDVQRGAPVQASERSLARQEMNRLNAEPEESTVFGSKDLGSLWDSIMGRKPKTRPARPLGDVKFNYGGQLQYGPQKRHIIIDGQVIEVDDFDYEKQPEIR